MRKKENVNPLWYISRQNPISFRSIESLKMCLPEKLGIHRRIIPWGLHWWELTIFLQIWCIKTFCRGALKDNHRFLLPMLVRGYRFNFLPDTFFVTSAEMKIDVHIRDISYYRLFADWFLVSNPKVSIMSNSRLLICYVEFKSIDPSRRVIFLNPGLLGSTS